MNMSADERKLWEDAGARFVFDPIEIFILGLHLAVNQWVGMIQKWTPAWAPTQSERDNMIVYLCYGPNTKKN